MSLHERKRRIDLIIAVGFGIGLPLLVFLAALWTVCVVFFVSRAATVGPYDDIYMDYEPAINFQDEISTVEEEAESTLQEILEEDWDVEFDSEYKEYLITPTNEDLIEMFNLYFNEEDYFSENREEIAGIWDDLTDVLLSVSLFIEENENYGYVLYVVNPDDSEYIWLAVEDGVIIYNIADYISGEYVY